MDWLSTPVGPLTVQQWGLVVFAIVVAFSLVNWLTGSKRHDSRALTRGRCLGCGWEGSVSKYHRTCPKCGNKITRLSKGEP